MPSDRRGGEGAPAQTTRKGARTVRCPCSAEQTCTRTPSPPSSKPSHVHRKRRSTVDSAAARARSVGSNQNFGHHTPPSGLSSRVVLRRSVLDGRGKRASSWV